MYDKALVFGQKDPLQSPWFAARGFGGDLLAQSLMRNLTCSAANKRREKLEAFRRLQKRRQNLIEQVAAAPQDAGDLIDLLIDAFPDAPGFASIMVDRLMDEPTPELIAAVSNAVAPLQGGQR